MAYIPSIVYISFHWFFVGRLGRYPVHFHLNGDMNGSYVRGLAIHETFNRAINVHGTHNMLVEHTVIHNVMGGALFLEDGIETIIKANNPALPTGFIYTLNLARVFLKESNILLLDELPNASLNEDVGEAYKKIISDSKGDKTLFFVSQRDDYLKLADRIIVFNPGNRPTIMKSDEFINKYGQF